MEIIRELYRKDKKLAMQVAFTLGCKISAKKTRTKGVTDRVLRQEMERVLKKADKLRGSANKLQNLLEERIVGASASDNLVNLARRVDKLIVVLPNLVHALKNVKL